jgi:hypothetical protein
MKRKLSIGIFMILAVLGLGCENSSSSNSSIVSGTISGWSAALSNAGYSTSSGIYAQAVICSTDANDNETEQVTISNQSIVGSDGSFSITLETPSSAYLQDVSSILESDSGLTASPTSGISLLGVGTYGVELWLFNSSGNAIGSIWYQTNASGNSPCTFANMQYSTGTVTVTGNLTDQNDSGANIPDTVNMSFESGWNWALDSMTSTAENDTTTPLSTTPSGLSWYPDITTTTSTAPYISGVVITTTTGSAIEEVIGVYTSSSFTTPITNAIVTVGGTQFTYSSTYKDYQCSAAPSITPGSSFTVSVTVNGETYSVTPTQFPASQCPAITAPVSGEWSTTGTANNISWGAFTAMASNGTYKAGLFDISTGTPGYSIPITSTAGGTINIPGSYLTSGSDYLAGTMVYASTTIPNALSGSGITFGMASCSIITATNSD